MRNQNIDIGSMDAENVSFGSGRAGDTYEAGADRPERHAAARPRRTDRSRDVFVIHGRDLEARDALFDFLRALGLRPLEWEQLVPGTGRAAPSLADVVTNAPRDAHAVVALLTPDDVVALHPSLHSPHDTDGERAVSCQARPNVYLELGMALAINPDRTIILEAGTIRRPADLAGLNYIRIGTSAEWCNKVAERLQNAGCPVDRSGTDWQRVDRFTRLAAYDRRPPPWSNGAG